MQTRTGARSKLKGFITRNQNHSKAGKKLETKELENARGDNKTKLYKTREETCKHRQSVDYGGDGEDLTNTERKTGD